jgi:putative ABC transport system substrate-binding protein
MFLFTAIDDPVVQTNIGIMKQGLRTLGYIEGEHVVYDGRSAERDSKRFPALAKEVVGIGPDVIICQNVIAALELKAATSTIPIVFVAINADPLESEVVPSLARPGGNITGIGIHGADIAAKQVELLKEAVPSLTRVAVIQEESRPRYELAAMENAAAPLGVVVLPIFISSVDQLDAALDAAVAARAEGLIHRAGFITGTQAGAAKIVEFAMRHRWPTVNIGANVGGLINYSGVLVDPWSRGATYVDRILKGANPGDLPVEGATGSTLVINMCTAARLALTIPQSVLARSNTLVQCPAS